MRVPRICPPYAGVLLVVGLLAPAGASAGPVSGVSEPPRPEAAGSTSLTAQFVQGSGTSLTLDGNPFRLKGAAIYGPTPSALASEIRPSGVTSLWSPEATIVAH